MSDYDYDTSRGPYYAMLDRQAGARQAVTGESFEKAFTECYCDPSNAVIRDNATYEHLAQGYDSTFGYRLSAIPVAKAAPAFDPIRKHAELAEHLGPAHAKLHSLAVDHQRAHGGMSYQQAYSHLYSRPENVSLRNAVKAEHMQATMSGVGQGLGKAAAPADALQDDVDPSRRGDNPGPAHAELHRLIGRRMNAGPGMSYERAFTAEYLHPDNRSLKARVDAESVIHAQGLSPAKPFPAYTAPGHSGDASNIGRSGAKPRGYAGG
jgi:hypothetical protein